MNLIYDIFRGLSSLRTWAKGLLFFAVLVCLKSYGEPPSKRVTLWRKDKIPYGTYIAYESLPQLFPNAEISVNRKSITTLAQKEGKKALIFIGAYADIDQASMNALLNF